MVLFPSLKDGHRDGLKSSAAKCHLVPSSLVQLLVRLFLNLLSGLNNVYGNLFVRTDKQYDLRSFAAAVFDSLSAVGDCVRESGNYVTGEYITASALGITMKVAVADDSEFPDYQFWINFTANKAWPENPSSFDGIADVVAKILALEGYEVARALAYGKIGGARILYTRKALTGDVRNRLTIRSVN